TGYVLPQQTFGPRETIAVVAGKTSTIELRLKKGAVLAGRVFDESGAPLADVRVMAMRRFAGRGGMQPPQLVSVPTSGMGMLQTNDIGEFRIAGLAAGEYYIAATRSINSIVGAMSNASSTPGTPGTPGASGTQGRRGGRTYLPGPTDQNAAQPVAIAEGDTKSGVEFRMVSVPSFRISGRVVDEQGAPVARAMVMLAADPRGGAFVGPAGNA